jgi:hypothetical protein
MTKIQISKHKKRGVQNALFWSLNIDGFVKSRVFLFLDSRLRGNDNKTFNIR